METPDLQLLASLDPGRSGAASARPGCCPVARRAVLRSRQAPAASSDAAAAIRPVPQVLSRTTIAWRRACLEAKGRIPSGYTYLAQLMGHDVGSSVALTSVPHVQRDGLTAAAALGTKRYNLIDNPLTLESIYGPGPQMLSHVYDPKTLLFRLTPGARLARVFRIAADPTSADDRQPIRALYDERNRDTLMLHELAVAWMQFHNLCARTLMGQGLSPQAAHIAARLHCVWQWHDIIRTDILPRFVHPDIAAMQPGDLPECWSLETADLLLGLFRAFHAMPLSAYDLGRSGQHNLRSLMKTGFETSDGEAQWAIDWPFMFGAQPGGPVSGLSASVAPQLRMPESAMAVIVADGLTADDALPLRLGNPSIGQCIAALPDEWPARMTAAALAQDFTAMHPEAPFTIDAAAIERGPLFQALMVEAHLHGVEGGLGPLGSALLMATVHGTISRIVPRCPQQRPFELPRPERMLDLITLVRGI